MWIFVIKGVAKYDKIGILYTRYGIYAVLIYLLHLMYDLMMFY